MSRLILRRLAKPLVVLVGFVLVTGCSGEEKIPLKKIDFLPDIPKDFKETRKSLQQPKYSSARIKGDPSGVKH